MTFVENSVIVAALLVFGVVQAFLTDWTLVELALVIAFVLLAKRMFVFPVFDRLEAWGASIASHRTLCIVLAFLTPMLLRAAALPWNPIPLPWVPDEFSHLLLADTLSHARFANPAHPLWQHFETIHVFFQPVYASPYFPALGIAMAAGKLLGHYWIGILLSSGLMCAALLWMLYGMMPARWALLGAIAAILKWGVASYWVNSYWGGSVAAAAGALVLGAGVRLRRAPSLWNSVALGVGLVALAYSRPLEGFVFAVPVLLALGWRYARNGRFYDALRVALPTASVGIAGLLGLACYCRAITGSPFVVPYAVNQRLYGWPLTLPWQRPQPVVYRHSDLRLYYEWEQCIQHRKSDPREAIAFSSLNLAPLWRFYFGPALTVPLFGIRKWWRDSRIRIPLVCASISLALALLIAAYPHYVAPATGCFLAIVIQAVRHLRLWNRKFGIALSRAVMVACVVMLPVRIFCDSTDFLFRNPGIHTWSAQGSGQGAWRANILRALQSKPGRHIVFVQYNRLAYLTSEWVYNEADIDASRVVWAQDMGDAKNQEVLRYYPDRRAWIVQPDDDPGELVPYSPALARAEAPSTADQTPCVVHITKRYVDSKTHRAPKPNPSSSQIF
ncbi:MAG TPA: hypothetical protein VMF91_16040 [Bryobacteraceae bacterium]|nr:hypothetical protein [Bryobacteraceae bacterium]